jgi:hypothetical protein
MVRVFFNPTTSRNDPEILKQTTKSSDYSNLIRLWDLPLISATCTNDNHHTQQPLLQPQAKLLRWLQP